MELLFKTQMLRTICEEEARAVSMLGVEAADRLRSRLADLRAAGTVSDLVAGNPSFSGDRNSELRIRLDDEHVNENQDSLLSRYPRDNSELRNRCADLPIN